MKSFSVIFDMDGVLVESNPYHKRALQQFCEAHGYFLSEEKLKSKIYGRTNKDWITNLFEGNLSAGQLQQYADEKEALYRQLFKGHVEPVKGLISFLDLLQNHDIKFAIATSAPRANVDFTLTEIGESNRFETILDDSFVEKGKPDPEIYLKTAAALATAPADCIVIEDSISGVISGRDSGAKVIGITTTHSKDELGKYTDLVIDDFDELTIDALNLLFSK